MKPTSLLYGLEDRPPLLINAFLGLQHFSIIAISFVFPILLIHEGGGTTDQAAFVISMSMLAGGIGVIVQSLHKGPVGSGYICPQLCGPSYLAASFLCMKTGGLPLVFGMTAFAGAIEALFSRAIHKLRVLFPTEVTGLIVAMVGITVVKMGGQNFLDIDPSGAINGQGAMIGGITLAIMVGLNVWTQGKVKLFCALIGMVAGYTTALLFGALTVQEMSHAMSRPAIWFPVSFHPGWAFDVNMVLPIIIAVICSSLKSVGDITTCQKINDTQWKRPDMDNIQKGILADAVGCFSAGIFGGFGQSTSSTNIGLTIATGATSRAIAWSTGVILITLAFCPKITGLFAIMPRPVVGATLVFALGFMIVAGIQIIMSRMLDGRKTFIIGLSIICGLTVDLLPQAFADLHPILKAIFSSSLSAATISALVLNQIFRIGIKTKASLTLESDTRYHQAIVTFMEKQGSAWAARPEIIKKATAATIEYLEALGGRETVSSITAIEASFDEYNLDISITHLGNAPELPETAPSMEKIVESDGARQLAGFLIRSWADKITTKYVGEETQTKLHFKH